MKKKSKIMLQFISSFLIIQNLVTTPILANNKITVLLDWFINPDHAPLIVAQEMEFFKSANLQVTLVAPSDPSMPPKLVAAGKADIAVSYQPQLHVQVDQGLPLVRIGTLVSTPLNSLVVLRDGPINSIKDLKNRKIGFSVGGFEDAILSVMLKKHGLTLKDVTLINVNFSLSPSIISGKVDAVIGAFRNFELNQMELEKKPGRAFYPEEEGVTTYDELILVTHRSKINEKKLRRFVDSIERAVQFLVNHPKKGWEIFAKKHPKLNDELNRRAWQDTLPRFAMRPGALDRARYRRFAEFLKQQGLIKKVKKPRHYAIELP